MADEDEAWFRSTMAAHLPGFLVGCVAGCWALVGARRAADGTTLGGALRMGGGSVDLRFEGRCPLALACTGGGMGWTG